MAARAAAGRRRSASIGCAGRSPITPRTRSRAASSPGSPDLERIRHEIWDDNNLGNAIPGATPRAQIDVRHWLPALPLQGARGAAADGPDARPQPLDAAVPRAGQLRPAPGPPRRAAARRARRDAQPRLRARLAAGRHRRPAAAPTCAIEIPAPERPGRYTLKFDLVSEGIDWFEACGSDDDARATLVVR